LVRRHFASAWGCAIPLPTPWTQAPPRGRDEATCRFGCDPPDTTPHWLPRRLQKKPIAPDFLVDRAEIEDGRSGEQPPRYGKGDATSTASLHSSAGHPTLVSSGPPAVRHSGGASQATMSSGVCCAQPLRTTRKSLSRRIRNALWHDGGHGAPDRCSCRSQPERCPLLYHTYKFPKPV
jgi:hypothetical protein